MSVPDGLENKFSVKNFPGNDEYTNYLKTTLTLLSTLYNSEI